MVATALAAAALPTQGATATPGTTPGSLTEAQPADRAARQGTLAVTPAAQVAGQAITFKGTLPRVGRRQVHLQFHMNRPGDKWHDVKNSTRSTTASGAFNFQFPAPAMFNISYRVVSGNLVTKPHLFYPRPQAVALSVNGQDQRGQYVTVFPGLPFSVVVNSSADIYLHRELKPPVFTGRVITLQQRVAGNRWLTVGTARADSRGLAAFTLPGALSGERVFRARAENVHTKGHRIGWTSSWPTYVRFSLLPDYFKTKTAPTNAPASSQLPPITDSTGATDASGQFGWYRPTYDFAWEYGESLSSPPTRGKARKGRWLEYTTGSGRVVTFNGALAFQSRLLHKGPGDRGTTSATVTGNAQRYGRWEFRSWQNVFEQDGRDFRMRIELVPAGTRPGACSPETIRVADMALGRKSHTVGVRSAQTKAEWTRTTRSPAWSGLHNFAVEVAKDHITWFFDGKAIATVKNKTAIKGKPLVPRISMVGSEDSTEHNGAQFSVDWVRAWTLGTGRQARAGKALSRTAFSPTC